MIVVFSPVYADSKYCIREFLAMENIEKKRKEKIGSKFDRTSRMIIPIIFRGDPDRLPPKIKDIHYYDFSKFTLASLKLSKRDKEIIEQIAKRIYDHYENIKSSYNTIIDDECTKFLLPSEDEAIHQWGPSLPDLGFPGRSKV